MNKIIVSDVLIRLNKFEASVLLEALDQVKEYSEFANDPNLKSVEIKINLSLEESENA